MNALTQREVIRSIPRGPTGTTGAPPVPFWENDVFLGFKDSNGNPLAPPVNVMGPQGPAGDAQNFLTVGRAEASIVSAGLNVVTVFSESDGALIDPVIYTRQTSDPGDVTKFRSSDRFVPDGSPDATDGGWWAPAPTPIKILSDNYIDVKAHYGVVGDGSSGYADCAKMQYALDHAPLGCVLVCPPALVPLNVPLVMSRPMSIKMDQNFQLRGDFGVGALDVLQIGITDTGLGGDVRNLVIEGGYLWSQYQKGDGVININPTPADYLPHFELLIRNVKMIGNFRAVRIGGANASGDTNFCTIEGCNIGINSAGAAAVDLDNCADGHRIINNLIFGVGSGVRVNVVVGAFNTTIQGNGLVTRDGGVLIRNGSRVLIDGNQIEQQGGVNGLSASIVIQGNDYKSAGNIITRNNFGGGGNVDHNIRVENSHHNFIDLNQMNVTAIDDVTFLDAGGGKHADYNTIGGRNTFRGTRAIQANMTDANRRMIISESAACVGNRGIWRPGLALTFYGGAAPDNLSYMVDESSILHWEGHVIAGAVTAGASLFDMPAGCRPINAPVIQPVGTPAGVGVLTFNQAGAASIGGVNLPSTDVSMSGISYPVNWMDTYDVGP